MHIPAMRKGLCISLHNQRVDGVWVGGRGPWQGRRGHLSPTVRETVQTVNGRVRT